MDRLRCVVERITYQNAENGYSVLRLRAKGYTDIIDAVRNMAGVHIKKHLSAILTGSALLSFLIRKIIGYALIGINLLWVNFILDILVSW